MRSIHAYRGFFIPATALFFFLAFAGESKARSAAPWMGKRYRVQIEIPVLSFALGRLATTRRGAPIAEYIRRHVNKVYFFDPESPSGSRYARYDGYWDRLRGEIAIRKTLGEKATDYLVSVLAHEGAHAMNSSIMVGRIERVSAARQYAALMVQEEKRAFKIQVNVWLELRSRVSTLDRLFYSNRGDSWMGRIRKQFQSSRKKVSKWLATDLHYAETYRGYWVELKQGLTKLKKGRTAGESAAVKAEPISMEQGFGGP